MTLKKKKNIIDSTHDKNVTHDFGKKENNKQKKEKIIRKEKGITLIALVITIIVLLILAGVSIATLTGQNGVLTKANSAKNKTEEAGVKEEIELAVQEIITERYDKETLSVKKIADYLPEKLEKIVIYEVLEDKIRGQYKGYDFEINSSFVVKIVGKSEETITYTIEPEGYTKDFVTITLQVEFKNNASIVQLTPVEEGVETLEANKKFKVTKNGNYIFKLLTSNQIEKQVTIPIKKIDRIAPNVKIEIDETTNYINGKVKAKVTLKDLEAGVELSKSKWIINQSSNEIGNNLEDYTGGTFTKETQIIETGTVTSGSYYIHILATDKVGNVKETVSKEIKIKSGYAIYTPEDLQNMKNDLSASYYVMNDIDMSEFNFTPIDGYFTGELDGQGHTIENLSISGTDYVGIFRKIKSEAKICNLLLKNVNINATGYRAGVLAGQIEMGETIIFEKIGITGKVVAERGIAAGFVGDVIATSKISFQNCYARIDIVSSNRYDAAGFANYNYSESLLVSADRCYWSGSNNATGRASSILSYSNIANNANQAIGKDIYVKNTYYDKEKFPLSINTTTSGTGLTTEEMKKQTSYVGWDFENTWYMGEDGYPELKFKNK